MTNKTQEESELFVKAYQLQPVVESLGRIEQKMERFITEDALKLELQPIHSEISSLKEKNQEKDKNRVWFNRIIVSAILVLLVNFAWGLISNSGRL